MMSRWFRYPSSPSRAAWLARCWRMTTVLTPPEIRTLLSSVGPWSVLLHCVIRTRRDCFGYFKQGRYVIAKGALLLDEHKQRICARFPLGALKGYGQHFSQPPDVSCPRGLGCDATGLRVRVMLALVLVGYERNHASSIAHARF